MSGWGAARWLRITTEAAWLGPQNAGRRQARSTPVVLAAAASADAIRWSPVSRQPYRCSLLQRTVKRLPFERHFLHPHDPGDGGREGTWSVRVRPASARIRPAPRSPPAVLTSIYEANTAKRSAIGVTQSP